MLDFGHMIGSNSSYHSPLKIRAPILFFRHGPAGARGRPVLEACGIKIKRPVIGIKKGKGVGISLPLYRGLAHSATAVLL